MTVETLPFRIARHEDAETRWELVSRPPPPALAAYVMGYMGYVEQTRRVMRRRELPFAGVPLIVSFGPSIALAGARDLQWTSHHSFVAGLDDVFTLTEYSGAQHGLQVNFTPLGAYRFFGLPMHEIAQRVAALDDVLGPAAESIVAELRDARDWAARFSLMDRLIVRRTEAGPTPSPGVAWAWRRIRAAGGALGIGGLARELGCSRKHLIARFREEIGLPPKLLARIERFQRAKAMLARGEAGLAEIALDCGYFDQAHFNRDFQCFAGVSPGEIRRALLPDGAGIRA
jgi:AraC-like DNA-binding protein